AGQLGNLTCTGCQTVCGDGIVGSGETCDPPGQQGACPAGESCNLTCTGCQTVCGDGIVGSGETCDPPGSQSTCGVGTICNSRCTGCEQNCGDLWQTGPAMDAACGPCVAAVCSSDSGCCSVTWDSTCVSVALFLSAGGVCPVPSCFTSQAPTCGGECPSGQVCGQGTGGGSCGCVAPDSTCDISQAPTCGGTCPSRQVCGQASGQNYCRCLVSDDTCSISH